MIFLILVKPFQIYFQMLTIHQNLSLATLFARRGMKYPEQLLYAEKTLDDSYVVFPWDKFEFENSLK